MYNDNRFKLPNLNIVAGTNVVHAFDVINFGYRWNPHVLNCKIDETAEVKSDQWLIDSSTGNRIVPTSGTLYRIVDDASEYYGRTFCWFNQIYSEVKYRFALINYSNQYHAPIVGRDCLFDNGKITLSLSLEDTLYLYGKYIYQVSFYILEKESPVYIAEQGLAFISRNIDSANIVDMMNDSDSIQGLESANNSEDYSVYIVGTTPFAADWLSYDLDGVAFEPNGVDSYTVMTAGEYYGKTYKWNDDTELYEESTGGDE